MADMVHEALYLLSSFTSGFAALCIGLISGIVALYWRKHRHASGPERLRTTHVMLVGLGMAMLAVVGVARLSDIPHPATAGSGWWVYPWIAAAFVAIDAALFLILRFVMRRSAGD